MSRSTLNEIFWKQLLKFVGVCAFTPLGVGVHCMTFLGKLPSLLVFLGTPEKKACPMLGAGGQHYKFFDVFACPPLGVGIHCMTSFGNY